MGAVDISSRMKVLVLLFAQVRDRLGQSEVALCLPNGSRGQDVIARLIEWEPSLKPILEVSRLAVNCEYVPLETVLREGDEVAMISPVSGG